MCEETGDLEPPVMMDEWPTECATPDWSDNCTGELVTNRERKKGLCEGCMAVIQSWGESGREPTDTEVVQTTLLTDGGGSTIACDRCGAPATEHPCSGEVLDGVTLYHYRCPDCDAAGHIESVDDEEPTEPTAEAEEPEEPEPEPEPVAAHPDARLEAGEVLVIDRADGRELVYPARETCDEPYICESRDAEGELRTTLALTHGDVFKRMQRGSHERVDAETIETHAPEGAAIGGDA
ncbi:hypothetical protein ACFQGT_00285 [Natrialbaceae archaeon GCM10025810]